MAYKDRRHLQTPMNGNAADQMDVQNPSFWSKILRRNIANRLGIKEISIVMRQSRLRWFGHVERLDKEN